ncbi:Yip1 family protein [Bacillus ndiopicus]|uniref:Yip1 family protein n=1 Tax=Bacillus ndiopicus TaxID=1347368 RepID=UPI0005A7DFB1|nr:Yip1 family protein [Bacillus ndiopicus]
MDNKTLNPFLSVWLHPKQTARYMIDHKTLGFAAVILLVCSIISLPVNLLGWGEPVSLGSVISMAIFSPIVTILGVAFSVLIIWGIGKLFKGSSTYADMFKAMSIVSIPSIILSPFYLIWFIVEPEVMLYYDYLPPYPAFFTVIALLSFIILIWGFVLSVGVVAEAHRFSNWRAFFTLMVPVTILFVILFTLFALAFWAMFSTF